MYSPPKPVVEFAATLQRLSFLILPRSEAAHSKRVFCMFCSCCYRSSNTSKDQLLDRGEKRLTRSALGDIAKAMEQVQIETSYLGC